MLKTVQTGNSGGSGNGTVTSITAGTGITVNPSPIIGAGNVSISNTTVTAGVYGSNGAVSQITINAQGQATNAANVGITLPVANVIGAVPDTVYVIAGTGLAGGGALTGNVTLTANVTAAVTNIATGTGLTGGPITGTGTISIANTTVTAGVYGNATAVSQITFNAQGQATGASNVAILLANANLANSAITLGNTSVSLGSTATTLGNLTLTNANVTTQTAGTNSNVAASTAFVETAVGALAGYISGLTMSTAGGSATLTVAAGVATDSTNKSLMALPNSLAKTTSAWVLGAGGGLDTGSIANSTVYHWYEIQRPDTGVTDITFSLNATTPALPANYTLYRRIFSAFTDGSAHWVQVVQNGGDFDYYTALSALDLNGTTTSVSRTLQTISVPTGIIVKARLNLAFNNSVAAAMGVWLSNPATADTAPSTSAGPLSTMAFTDNTTASFVSQEQTCWTNTSAQIGVRGTNATDTVFIQTLGWYDPRGQ